MDSPPHTCYFWTFLDFQSESAEQFYRGFDKMYEKTVWNSGYLLQGKWEKMMNNERSLFLSANYRKK